MTSLIHWQRYPYVKCRTGNFTVELVAAKPGLSPAVEYKWRGSDEMAGIRRCLTCVRTVTALSAMGHPYTLHSSTSDSSDVVRDSSEIRQIVQLQTFRYCSCILDRGCSIRFQYGLFVYVAAV